MENPTVEVINILQKKGPCLSSTVAQELQAAGLTPAAARKRIERAKAEGAAQSLLKLKFKHNEQFLFTVEQRQSPEFIQALLGALHKSRSSYRLPLLGIAARGGIVPKQLFATVSAAPIESKNKTVTAAQVLDDLIQLQLLDSFESKAGTCIRLHPQLKQKRISDYRMMARLAAENLLLLAFRDWLRLQGLISAESASLRNDITRPQFGYYQWDFVAPSYARPLVHLAKTKNTPGFVVADTILGRILNENDIEAFITKCRVLSNQPNIRPFMAFLIADWFSKEALALGRQHGLILTTTKNLFGIGFSRMLDTLMQALEDKKSLATSTRDTWSALTDAKNSIQHLDSAYSQLKENLFELIIGTCLQRKHTGKITYGEILSMHGKTDNQQEADILIVEPGEKVIAAECKALSRLITAETIQAWLSHVKNMVRILRQDRWFYAASYKFYFCTSGKVTQDARATLQAEQHEPESSGCDFEILDYDAIVEMVKEPGLCQIFEQWYGTSNPDYLDRTALPLEPEIDVD